MGHHFGTEPVSTPFILEEKAECPHVVGLQYDAGIWKTVIPSGAAAVPFITVMRIAAAKSRNPYSYALQSVTCEKRFCQDSVSAPFIMTEQRD